MTRYRVGSEGVRVMTDRGVYSLPPGVLLDELPERYEGQLFPEDDSKAVHGYADKRIRAPEDKAL